MSDEKKSETNVEGSGAAAGSTESAHSHGPHSQGALPPASLTLLISTLGTQALMSLGRIPNPLTNQTEVSREQARHCIDMLAMLERKTAGNRTTEESQMLDGILYELRMLFVQTQ